jgi:formiminotetrahydrofolate cyclodeaminase
MHAARTAPGRPAADGDAAVRDQTIGTFLDELAARLPAPGGGAVAALHGAQAAALLEMVARYSDGPRYAAGAGTISAVLTRAGGLREECLRLAEEDAAAFGAVGRAYGLPRDTEEAKGVRSAAIAAALLAAARPPAGVIAAAATLVELAETLLPVSNRNVITDVAAAAEAARAAATTARVNVEVNLSGSTDTPAAIGYREAVAAVDALVARAEAVTSTVRTELAR